ncbi:MAG: DNA ligase-associated DEXH box helicase, partial [Burkholderiaceae bacterium]|nr:DNA ligase-associated DEXH box helicase [Burkholderiaceae bacterium]
MSRLPPGSNVGSQLRARRLKQAREAARRRLADVAAAPAASGRSAVADARQPALPGVEAWFAAQGIAPFPFQREVWAHVAAGRSGLLHATTGAGKTYAACFGLLE